MMGFEAHGGRASAKIPEAIIKWVIIVAYEKSQLSIVSVNDDQRTRSIDFKKAARMRKIPRKQTTAGPLEKSKT